MVLADARQAARELVEIHRDLAQLVRRTFELAQRCRLLRRRVRHGDRALTVPCRDFGDALDAVTQVALGEYDPGFDIVERLPKAGGGVRM